MSDLEEWRSDEQLAVWDKRLGEKIQSFAAQGFGLQGLSEHYVQALLEVIAGEEGTRKAKVKHYQWLEKQVEEVEKQIGKIKLTQGINLPNGKRSPGSLWQ